MLLRARSVVKCAAGWTVIVPVESSPHVSGETDVVPLRVTLAAEDVHVSTRDAIVDSKRTLGTMPSALKR